MLTATALIFFLLAEASSKMLRMAVHNWDAIHSNDFMSMRSDRIRDFMVFEDYGRYRGTIGIGNPPQNLTVYFEPGYSDFWVLSSRCFSTITDCRNHVRYDSTKSSTFAPVGTAFDFTYEYITGSGLRSRDSVHLSGIEIGFQTFGEIVDLKRKYSENPFGGIMGLSLNSTKSNGYDSPLLNLYQRGFIDALKFSMYLTAEKGEILFGASDPGYYVGNMNYIPVISRNDWAISIDNIEFKKKYYCPRTCQGFIFANTPAIRPPKSIYQKIIKEIGKHANPGEKDWVPCTEVNNLPPLNFIIRGSVYSFSPEEYILKVFTAMSDYLGEEMSTGNKCYLAIWENIIEYLSDYWVLGTAFMRKYYLEFDIDQQRLGIALAAQD